MAFSFGGLVNGLSVGVGGALRGANTAEAERYKREQEKAAVLRAALQQSFLNEQATTPEWKKQGYTSRQEADKVRFPTVADMPAIPPTIPEQMVEMNGDKGPGVYRVTRGSPPEYMGKVIPKEFAPSVPKPGMPGGPLKPLPVAQEQAISGLRSLLRSTRGAQADFEAHPGAFGPQNRIPLYDLIPGSGSQYRLNMGDIVSQIGKLRSGGAITPQEFQRLERFLPNPGSLDEKNAAAIPRLLQELETILREKTTYYARLGYAVPEDVDAPSDLQGDGPPPTPASTPTPAAPTSAQDAYNRWKANRKP